MQEIWKDIAGFEGRYQVSNKGNVKSLYFLGHNAEKLMKLSNHHSGYLIVQLGKHPAKTYLVHQLVARAFIPLVNGKKFVNHIDGNKHNNCVDNLEWVSHEENIKRSYERGNHVGRATGVKNTRAKLDESLVTEMRIEYWYYSTPIMTISKKYNVPWSTVSHVVNGETWVNIPMPELTPEVEELLKKNPRFNPRPKE